MLGGYKGGGGGLSGATLGVLERYSFENVEHSGSVHELRPGPISSKKILHDHGRRYRMK